MLRYKRFFRAKRPPNGPEYEKRAGCLRPAVLSCAARLAAADVVNDLHVRSVRNLDFRVALFVDEVVSDPDGDETNLKFFSFITSLTVSPLSTETDLR